MKSILIGCNGYLGKHLAVKLEQYGFDNANFDVQESPAPMIHNYQPFDITKKEQYSRLNPDVDYIFHFAGLTGTANGFEKYEQFYNVNELGLLNLLNWMKENSCNARVVFPSTRLVYRGKKNHALHEDDAKETKTIYALNKLASENLLWMYSNAFGINYTVFRICVPYGNNFGDAYSYGTLGFFLNNAIKGEDISLYGDGNIRRTFTHIDDITRIIAVTVESSVTKNDIFNIGGEDRSLFEVARMIADKFNVGVGFVDWPEMALKLESDNTVFSDVKLKKAFGVGYEQNLENWIKSLGIE